MGVLDLIFPKYCVSCTALGSYVCADCFTKLAFSEKQMCLICGKGAIDGITHPVCQKKWTIDGCMVGLEYAGVAKKLIYRFKYKPFIADLQTTLVDFLYESLIQKPLFQSLLEKEQLVVTAIPLHKNKLRKRGYNHAAILGKNLAHRFNLAFAETLVRTKETAMQAGLTKEQRKQNLKDAFSLKKGLELLIQNKTVLLIDDIVTTGATFLEGAKTLKKTGAKQIFGIALAGEY